MALINALRKTTGDETKIYTSTILVLNRNGKHIISNGRSAGVVTDERLRKGDNVMVIEDENNRPWILGGNR